jgi:hypothetical protein
MTDDVPVRFDLRITPELGLALQEYRRNVRPVIPSTLDAIRELLAFALTEKGYQPTPPPSADER